MLDSDDNSCDEDLDCDHSDSDEDHLQDEGWPHVNLLIEKDEHVDINEATTDQLLSLGNEQCFDQANDLTHDHYRDKGENPHQTLPVDLKTRLFQRIGISLRPCNICNCSNYAGRPYSDEACLNCGHFRDMHC